MIFDTTGLSGLYPTKWICVGAGYSREDLKAQILKRNESFTGHAVTSLADLCRKILSAAGKTISRDQILSPLSRQEVLRHLLSDRRIISRFPELKRLKRQRSFFKKLDWSIQSGRMVFSHLEEEEALAERLNLRQITNHVRPEVKLIAHAYETWMLTQGLWDLPMLLRAAKEEMQSQELQEIFPKEIIYYTSLGAENLEKSFWEEVQRRTNVTEVKPTARDEKCPAKWERWHTADDAADSLARRLAQETDWSDSAVLIPEDPGSRRTLYRALRDYGVAISDTRDPTRMKWDETLKWALLPLEMVARNFERAHVTAWLGHLSNQYPVYDWINEINQRGIRFGLHSYEGGKLTQLHTLLSELQKKLGGKLSCFELAASHSNYIAQYSKNLLSENQKWIIPFIEKTWKAFITDMRRIDIVEKKAPPLFWFERFSYRALESQVYEKFKWDPGVNIYRFQQACLTYPKKVYVLGIPSQWLESKTSGDYWFTEKEREVLSSEFAVRSSVQLQEDQQKALQSWFSHAQEIVVLDYQYSFDGKERESILPLLETLKLEVAQAEEKGSFDRWKNSYSAFRPFPPQKVQLSRLPNSSGQSVPQVTAVEIDRYSRCSFQALALSRWRLWDTREPDSELWPDVRGNILHEAVRILLRERTSIQTAIERAWVSKRAKGLLQGKRVEAYVKSKLYRVLEEFMEKEKEYLERTNAQIVSLDEKEVRIESPEFSVLGKPDRIDETKDGLFIMDYKTSSDLPNGTEMLEFAYRLQLPFYAVAVEKNLKKPALGVQFIELNKKAGRSKGVFFKKFNGKESGKLTTLRSNSKSLLDSEPETVWSTFENQIIEHGKNYVNGVFEAKPKFEEECLQCSAMDLCGLKRVSQKT